MTRRNPARAAPAGYTGATLTPGHFDLPAVRLAARLAERVAAGEGIPLGRGNFGAATEIEGHVVKLPVAEDRHGRAWARDEIRAYLLHEAGVANELHEAGHGIVPVTVYAELADGTPALVREYGADPGVVSLAEIGRLVERLRAVEDEGAGWDVADDLLIFRRADGSLFVGDVGYWRKARPPRAPGAARTWDNNSQIPFLLSGWVRQEAKLPAGVDRDALAAALRTNPADTAAGMAAIVAKMAAEMEQGTDPDPQGTAGFLAETYGAMLAADIRGWVQQGLTLDPAALDVLDRIEQVVRPYGVTVETGLDRAALRARRRSRTRPSP